MAVKYSLKSENILCFNFQSCIFSYLTKFNPDQSLTTGHVQNPTILSAVHSLSNTTAIKMGVNYNATKSQPMVIEKHSV